MSSIISAIMEDTGVPIADSSENDQIVVRTEVAEGSIVTPIQVEGNVPEESQELSTESEAAQQFQMQAEFIPSENTLEVTQEAEPGMTFLDMNEFMDILYKCKFCSFSASTTREMSDHVLSVHIACSNNFKDNALEIKEDPQPTEGLEIKTEVKQASESKALVEDHMYTSMVSENCLNMEEKIIESKTEDNTFKEAIEEESVIPASFESKSSDALEQVEDQTLTFVSKSADALEQAGDQTLTFVSKSADALEEAGDQRLTTETQTVEATIPVPSGEAGAMQESLPEGDYQEIFMCGQCPDVTFTSMELCKLHMVEVHNINIIETEMETEEMETGDGISAMSSTDDKVSIGTQAALIKKPGRKRKQPEDQNEIATPLVNEEGVEIKLEPVDEIPEEMAIFSEEFLNERAREGKRRIKVPKNLQNSYYGSRTKTNSRKTVDMVESLPNVSPEKKPKVKNKNTAGSQLKCEYATCKAKFISELSLEHHKKCHRQTEDGVLKKGFMCFECNFNSIQWGPMRLHLWTKHAMDLDLLKCDKCEFHTDAEHKMESHQTIHCDERRYTCEICDQSFQKLSDLLDHGRMHKDKPSEEPQKRSMKSWYNNRQCHICNRVLASAKSLKKHIQHVHEKTKAFQCSFCGHTAARKHMLQLHLRTHTGERPYKCDLCSFTTGDHNTLRRHRLRHTGEKPYKCRHCPYECIQAISLKIHMKNKHADAEGLYYCRQCHYHTVNKQYWEQHERDHKSGLVDGSKELKEGSKDLQSGGSKEGQGLAQRELMVAAPISKRQKTNHVTLKEALQDLKIPIITADNHNNLEIVTSVDPATSSVMATTGMQPHAEILAEIASPAAMGPGLLQDAQQITEITNAGPELLTMGNQAPNIQYVYLSQGDDPGTTLPTTFLIEGMSPGIHGEIITALAEEEGMAMPGTAGSHSNPAGTITLTIQPDGHGNPQIVTDDGRQIVTGTQVVTETNGQLVTEDGTQVVMETELLEGVTEGVTITNTDFVEDAENLVSEVSEGGTQQETQLVTVQEGAESPANVLVI